MPNNDALIEFIRGFFAFALGLGTTYLTVYYKNRRIAKKKLSPEDREAFLFDRYEKALGLVDDDLQVARRINNEQAEQIDKMQETITSLRNELVEAQKVNHSLLIANIKLIKDSKPEGL